MTNDAINRACAELCGWRDCYLSQNGEPWGFNAGLSYSQALPPFTTSLDAAQMAFKALTEEQQVRASYKIINIAPGSMPMLATPLQWCEVILKAAGKWEDGK